MNSNTFDRVSFVSLFLVITLLPLFFLPFTRIPIETSKGLLLVVGLAICIICWCLARFFDGKITFPRSSVLFAGGGVILAFLLSAAFSPTPQVSFFGTMFDIGTFWFVTAGFLLMLMSSIILRDAKKAKMVLFGVVFSGAIVLVFQTLHLFLPQFLSLGVLASKTDNILGSLNTLAIFAGFLSLTSLLVVEFLPTSKSRRLMLQILIVLSMLIIAAVNFTLVWELLGIFALIIFVYKLSITSRQSAIDESSAEKKDFPVFPFFVSMVALLFFMSGNIIGGFLPNSLGIENTEVGPSFSATLRVTQSVLKENPVFGVGPNKFGQAWAMYKPASINSTPFWNTYFNSGSGLLPTFAATTGGLGILSLLVFLVLFITAGIKSVFSSIKNGANWDKMAFFVLALYLFVATFFYSVGAVVFLLALSFAGVFLGLSASSHNKGEISISYLNDHRKSFFSILSIVLILIITAALSFKFVERLASVSYFGKSLTAQNVPDAEVAIGKALRLYQNDLYLRTYSEVYLVKLNSLSTKEGATSSEADKANLQSTLDQAVSGAQAAVNFDPKNYLNFQSLGSVYERLLTSFGIKDSYAKAIEAYTVASTLNPNNPGLKLEMAIISLANQKNKEAKDYANAALLLKPDYLDAFIVLSQIATSEGDNANALIYAKTALSLSPTNADLIKYVDSLKKGNPTSAPTIETSESSKTKAKN